VEEEVKVLETATEDDGFGEVVELFKIYCDKFRPLDSRQKDHVNFEPPNVMIAQKDKAHGKQVEGTHVQTR